MKVGINYSALMNGSVPQPRAVAQHIEEFGLDSFWCGDHLSTEEPMLESSLALAAAVEATERLDIGFAVLQLPLRPPAWAIRQIGTLCYLAGDRLQLGVGVGGDRPDEWALADVPTRGRGKRTDELLGALPKLLSGRPTPLPGRPEQEMVMRPAVPVPPVWVGGHSTAALRRAARFGDGWLPALLTPDQVDTSLDRLGEFAAEAGRSAPMIGVQLFTTVASPAGSAEHRRLVRFLSERFRLSTDRANQLAIGGPPEALAERITEYQKVGVEHVVLSPIGTESWELRCTLAAEAKSEL